MCCAFRVVPVAAACLLWSANAVTLRAAEPIVIGGTDDVALESVRVVAVDDAFRRLAVYGEPSDPTRTPPVIRLFSIPDGKPLTELLGLSGPVQALQFAPGGTRLVSTGSDPFGETVVWDVRSGQPLHRLPFGGPSLTISRRGSRAVVACPKDLRAVAFDVRTGVELRRTPRVRFPVAPGPEGTRLLSRSSTADPRLWLYRLPAGTEIERIDRADRPAPSGAIAISPDRRTLLTTDGDARGILIDLTTGDVLRTLENHDRKLSAAGFSSDGRVVFTAGYDGKAFCIDLATGKTLASPEPHRAPITSAALSADGRWLVTGSVDRTVVLTPLGDALASRLSQVPPDEAQTDAAFEDLATADPQVAYLALAKATAVGRPSLIGFRDRLRELVVPAQNERIVRLLDELDHPSDVVRDAATDELRKLRGIARPLLVKTIRETASAEVRYRIRRILFGSEEVPRFSESDLRRMRRLLHLAERIGGEDAKALVDMIAENVTDESVLTDAKETRAVLAGN